MHGEMAQNMPLYVTDGLRSVSGTQVYVGDTAMCKIRDSSNVKLAPCRVGSLYVDENHGKHLRVDLRRFRHANEVEGALGAYLRMVCVVRGRKSERKQFSV